MSSSLSDYQLHRESSLLLRRLSGGRGFLVAAAGGRLWHLFTRRTGYRKPAAEVDADFVAAMRRQQMLVERPGGGLMAAEGGRVPGPGARVMAQFDPALTEASERLASDHQLARIESRATSTWNAALLPSGAKRAGGEGELPATAMAARNRFYAALDAVGPELSNLLCEICCLSAGLEQAERRLGLAGRSGRALLQVALTRLARHYGLPASEAPRRRGPVRQWALPDYRPELDG